MKATQRFKSYEVRIPKVIREARSAELTEAGASEEEIKALFPDRDYTAVDMTGSETAHEINASFEQAIGESLEKIYGFVNKVSEAVGAAGGDTAIFARVPPREIVAEKALAGLDFPKLLRDAFREAAAEQWQANHPEYANLLAEKAPTSSEAEFRI